MPHRMDLNSHVSSLGLVNTTFAGADLGTPEFAATVRDALTQVEDLLISELSRGEDFLTETAVHLAKAGGKRFRPTFTILCGFLSPDTSVHDLVRAATVVELVHLATLYHDDVMDEAEMRRGVVSANARWGNSVAILAGDYLFSRASSVLCALPPKATEIVSQTVAELVTGQLRETISSTSANALGEQFKKDGFDPVAQYMRAIDEKTASLIATGGRLAAMVSGAGDDQADRQERIGRAIGMSFQIADDIIDIASLSSDSGKTPGTDLREGVHTLPVLYALADEGAESERLRTILGGPVTDDALIDEALTLLRRSEGMRRAKEVVHDYIRSAQDELKQFPDSPARHALLSLAAHSGERLG